jgi:hypothetical protein
MDETQAGAGRAGLLERVCEAAVHRCCAPVQKEERSFPLADKTLAAAERESVLAAFQRRVADWRAHDRLLAVAGTRWNASVGRWRGRSLRLSPPLSGLTRK